MPSLSRYEKVTCEKCGTQTTKLNLARHKKKDVQLEHCIIPNVTISPQNPKTVCITTSLRSTAPQNLISPSSVNFLMQKFLAFMLYVNIKTLNTERRLDQEQRCGCGTHSGSC